MGENIDVVVRWSVYWFAMGRADANTLTPSETNLEPNRGHRSLECRGILFSSIDN
jgi:hypothetical protein